MNESLVQWVLMRRPEYLQSRLGCTLGSKIGENYTTDQGRIDFAYETKDEVLVVELETAINSRAKYDFCTDQVRRYGEIKFPTEKPVRFVILFHEENTPPRFIKLLREFKEVDVLPAGEFPDMFTSRTNYSVYRALARYFELIREGSHGQIELTDYGRRFRDNYNAQIIEGRASIRCERSSRRVSALPPAAPGGGRTRITGLVSR